MDADELGVLQWRCGHQVAAELLDELQPRYERIGDLARALHVARMRTTLPFEDTEDAALRLKQLAARLELAACRRPCMSAPAPSPVG